LKKVLPVIIMGIVVLSGLGAANVLNDDTAQQQIFEHFSFSNEVTLAEDDGYLQVTCEGIDHYLEDTGKPRLPVTLHTYEFSREVKIEDITLIPTVVKEQILNQKIIPVAQAVPLDQQTASDPASLLVEDASVYESNEVYPAEWSRYSIRCGLNTQGEPTTFVIVEVYPLRYAPLENTLYQLKSIDIRISFEEPETPVKTATVDTYDLVIIAPEIFSSALQPLIDHKNSHGIKTTLKTTEEIYSEYEGRDKPEQIKYFIMDAEKTMGIRYVMLAGGLKSYFYAKDKDDVNQGSKDWYVPVRYTNIRGGTDADPYGAISDLYYADLYRYNEETETKEFEDWDSNGNGIFAEWKFMAGDVLDLVPDVYVSRLACRDTKEVQVVVDKIIAYESASPDEKPWYSRMVGIAGRTFAIEDGKPDGEIVCDLSFEYMGDLVDEQIKVYASNINTSGPVPIAEDIVQAISEGAGFVNFEGHGFPPGWNTNWPEESPDDWHNWTGGIKLHNFLRLSNGDKLPVVIIGGCHNALFNITLLRALIIHFIVKNEQFYWSHDYPTPECMSWRLISKPNGGAIGSTGCTGYGFGGDTAVCFSAELEANFFYMIGQGNATTLAWAHQGGITKYITENAMVKRAAHCITVYQLFGDPSLRLGGFP
jgi:hypothetical protein